MAVHRRELTRPVDVARPPYLQLVPAADGSQSTRVGTVVNVADTAARVMALTWATDGRQLAFGLVSPGEDLRAGGSVIWTLDLDGGTFDRVASGWPAPFYIKGRLGFSGFDDLNPFEFGTEGGRGLGARLSGKDTDLAVTVAPGPLFYMYERKAAALTKGPEGVELSLRSRYWGNGRRVDAPSTHRYSELARPVISSDGHTLIVELVDFTGQRDVGVYDWRASEWKVLDYAWEPTTSPAPVVSGPIDSTFATSAVERLLHSWNRAPRRADMIAGSPLDRAAIPMKRPSFTLKKARRHGKVWTISGFVFGRAGGELLFRSVDFEVGSSRGRLSVTPRPTSELSPLTTVADAAAAVGRMVKTEVVAPGSLPDGARIEGIGAWGKTATIYANIPKPGGKDGGIIELQYGKVGFYGGCGGGSGKPREVTVGDQPALFDRVGTIRQVIWPATPGKEAHARFSVYGTVARDQILEVAESIESLR